MENKNEIKKAEANKKGVAFRNKVVKIIRSVPFLCTVIGLVAGAIGFFTGLFFGTKRGTDEIDQEYLGDNVIHFEYDEAGNIIGGPVETEN